MRIFGLVCGTRLVEGTLQFLKASPAPPVPHGVFVSHRVVVSTTLSTTWCVCITPCGCVPLEFAGEQMEAFAPDSHFLAEEFFVTDERSYGQLTCQNALTVLILLPRQVWLEPENSKTGQSELVVGSFVFQTSSPSRHVVRASVNGGLPPCFFQFSPS